MGGWGAPQGEQGGAPPARRCQWPSGTAPAAPRSRPPSADTCWPSCNKNQSRVNPPKEERKAISEQPKMLTEHVKEASFITHNKAH